MYKLIDYYTGKTIADNFKTEEEAKQYQHDRRRSAIENNQKVFNWLSCVEKYNLNKN